MRGDRRFLVLQAIVADYVATHEPVGSRALVDRHGLGVSPATVRNDMAALESEGLIAQPHTSSGRIPTDKGYREFVDRISEVKPLSAAERRAIVTFLESGIDLDDVLARAVRLLAQLTRQVAIIQYPTLTRATVRHLEMVSLTDTRLLLVVITDTGRVEQRIVELGRPLGDTDLAVLRELLSNALHGNTLEAASVAVTELAENAAPDLREAVIRSASVLVETLVDAPTQRLIMGGAANLTTGDFAAEVGNLRTVLEALEEQVVVLKLLTAAADQDSVNVAIGAETNDVALRTTSVVSTGYGSPGLIYGGVGVLGPTRMDYPGTIAAVATVARYVGEVLGSR